MATGIEKIRENLGNNIKKHRKELKLTQFELSIQADIVEDFLQSIEVGRKMPSMETLGKIADALKVEPYELLK